ncbi:MAG: MFS transporter [Anaerolineales bacterium]
MTLLLDPLFSSVALGHMIVDVLNGMRPVLLTYWAVQLGLSNASLALVSTVYVWVASLSQPLFGWLTDRLGSTRWTAAGGMLWLGGFFSLALFLPPQAGIACLLLASLGSGAFHPAGASQAVRRGRQRLAQRETTAAAWFFMFGQTGYFFGPIVGGPLLDRFGAGGLLLPALAALPLGLNTAGQLRQESRPLAVESEQEKSSKGLVARRGFFLALALVAALQAWAQQNMITFLPKYLHDLGQSATIYGLIAGLFMGGSALGNVIGGNLADRFGKQRVAATMLALAAAPLFVISLIGWSGWMYVLAPLSGALTGAVHSIIVVLAQRNLPAGSGLASGLILGFMFSAGALGTLLSGPLADAQGFPPVFQMTAGLALAASLLASQLQETSAVTQPA